MTDDPNTQLIAAKAREAPKMILLAWIIRVGLVALGVWLVQTFWGPYERLWYVVPAYAVVSLIGSFAVARMKLRRLEAIATAMTDTSEGRK